MASRSNLEIMNAGMLVEEALGSKQIMIIPIPPVARYGGMVETTSAVHSADYIRQIRAQYSKLVAPIRRFFVHALEQDVPIHIIGQEKTGTFAEHLSLIGRHAPANHMFVPDHTYICGEIQHRPASGAPDGKDTNYGAKVFAILTERYKFVLNLPVSTRMADFIQAPSLQALIGLERILATLPKLLSSQHENALLPIQLANSVASLSTYPSAQVLKLFSDARMKS